MEETNLQGMTPEDAHAYILEYATSKKLAEKELENLKADIASWLQKQELAKSQGREDLVQAVNAKLEELTSKQTRLQEEAAELSARIDAMKAQLPMLRARERTVDPDLLLAEMEMTLGKSTDNLKKEQELNTALNSMSADEALQKLKEKLNSEDSE